MAGKRTKLEFDESIVLKLLDAVEWISFDKLIRNYARVSKYANPSIFADRREGEFRPFLKGLVKRKLIESQKGPGGGYRLPGVRDGRASAGGTRKGKAKKEEHYYEGIQRAAPQMLDKDTQWVLVNVSTFKPRKKKSPAPDILAFEQLRPEDVYLQSPKVVAFEVKRPGNENPMADVRQAMQYLPYAMLTYVVYVDIDSKKQNRLAREFSQHDVSNQIGLAFFNSQNEELRADRNPLPSQNFKIRKSIDIVSRRVQTYVCPWCRGISFDQKVEVAALEGVTAVVCDRCYALLIARLGNTV